MHKIYQSIAIAVINKGPASKLCAYRNRPLNDLMVYTTSGSLSRLHHSFVLVVLDYLF